MTPERCDPLRRALLAALAAGGLASALPGWAAPAKAVAPGCLPWPVWEAFVARHVSQDGRVIDFATADQRTTSEGQSYGLFFALVNNDRDLFEKLLGWTRHNLCADRPDLRLPAWWWGKGDDGQWRVLDENSASDSDLWIAYVLLEAGRLWKRPGYAKAGQQMLELIRAAEVRTLDGLGPMLLPGREGFSFPGRWTLNPSYLPVQLLRRAAGADPSGPWSAIAAGTGRMLREGSPKGFAPDWLAWTGTAFGADPAKGGVGSYDAIRCYLWAGMLDATEPLRAGILKALSGPLAMLQADGHFAEKVQVATGLGDGAAPAGFSGALLPYLSVLRQPALLQAEQQRIPAPAQPAGAQLPYYERILVLFGQGWLEGRFRFAADGRLQPGWRNSACAAST